MAVAAAMAYKHGWTWQEFLRQPAWLVRLLLHMHRLEAEALREAAGGGIDELTRQMLDSRPAWPAPRPEDVKVLPDGRGARGLENRA